MFGKSLLRSTYTLYGADGQELATVTEKSMGVALLRRLVGFIPYIGNYANWLPIPYDLVFLRGDVVLGTHRRQLWKLMDVYTMDMSNDPGRTIDRRLLFAIAVGWTLCKRVNRAFVRKGQGLFAEHPDRDLILVSSFGDFSIPV